MKTRKVAVFASLLACGLTLVFAQSSVAVPGTSWFTGTWEGKINDLPAIKLKIEEAGGKISGVIVFYFQERSGPNSAWHEAGESRVPLLAPRVKGNTLRFEVRHHK